MGHQLSDQTISIQALVWLVHLTGSTLRYTFFRAHGYLALTTIVSCSLCSPVAFAQAQIVILSLITLWCLTFLASCLGGPSKRDLFHHSYTPGSRLSLLFNDSGQVILVNFSPCIASYGTHIDALNPSPPSGYSFV